MCGGYPNSVFDVLSVILRTSPCNQAQYIACIPSSVSSVTLLILCRSYLLDLLSSYDAGPFAGLKMNPPVDRIRPGFFCCHISLRGLIDRNGVEADPNKLHDVFFA